MKNMVSAACGLTILLGPLAAHAQRIDATRQREEHRIEQGAGSGQLDWREYRRLERRRVHLRRAERRMRAEHHGRLTPAERRWLHRQEADLSQRIWRLKHNRRGAYR